MNVREYLKNYNLIGDEIRRLNSDLNKLIEDREDIYNTLKAQVLSDMPKSQREKGEDVVSEAALQVIDQYGRSIQVIASRIKTLLENQDIFNNIWFIERIMNDEERRVIELRFFQELAWIDISHKLNYCERQCRRLANSAIYKLQFVLNRAHNP